MTFPPPLALVRSPYAGAASSRAASAFFSEVFTKKLSDDDVQTAEGDESPDFYTRVAIFFVLASAAGVSEKESGEDGVAAAPQKDCTEITATV